MMTAQHPMRNPRKAKKSWLYNFKKHMWAEPAIYIPFPTHITVSLWGEGTGNHWITLPKE